MCNCSKILSGLIKVRYGFSGFTKQNILSSKTEGYSKTVLFFERCSTLLDSEGSVILYRDCLQD